LERIDSVENFRFLIKFWKFWRA